MCVTNARLHRAYWDVLWTHNCCVSGGLRTEAASFVRRTHTLVPHGLHCMAILMDRKRDMGDCNAAVVSAHRWVENFLYV